ncbi:MAG: DUF3299 domain-containing protein [Verrucomicrobiota bacterium]
MNGREKVGSMKRAAGLLACGLAVAAVSCGKQDNANLPEVKGQPIASEVKGAPIDSPVAQPEPVATAKLSETPKPAVEVAASPAASQTAQPVAQTAPPSGSGSTTAAQGADDYLNLGFDKLASFNYEIPDESGSTNNPAPPQKDQIPKNIRDLNNSRVALKGFMLPLKVEGGLITELLIMRDQSMCCYGAVPKINEWVSVRMTSKGVKPIMDQAVTIYGKLKVGEIRENGYLVGIYEMDGERMSGPLDL